MSLVKLFSSPWLSGSIVGLMATSSKRAYAVCRASQVCCTHSPFPCHAHYLPMPTADLCPLLTRAPCWPMPTADPCLCRRHKNAHRQVWLSPCGISGPWCTRGCFEPSESLWWIWGVILSMIASLLPSYWGFSFSLGCGMCFFGGGIQQSPVQQQVAILEFSLEQMSSHPSTPPS